MNALIIFLLLLALFSLASGIEIISKSNQSHTFYNLLNPPLLKLLQVLKIKLKKPISYRKVGFLYIFLGFMLLIIGLLIPY
jgi:hypothetical protein